MSLTPAQTHYVEAADKPRSILAIPPRSILCDAPRLARLGYYLEAEFPDLNFVIASENRNVPDQPAAGIMVGRGGSKLFTDEEAEDVLGKVVDAMMAFVDHGERLH